MHFFVATLYFLVFLVNSAVSAAYFAADSPGLGTLWAVSAAIWLVGTVIWIGWGVNDR